MSAYRLTWIATLMFFIGYYALNIPVPLYLQSIGLPDWLLGVILGANVVASLLARPFTGALSDAWGRPRVMLLGAASLLLGAAGFSLTTQPVLLFFLRVLQVIGYVASTTASTALIADLSAPERRGAAIAMLGTAANLAITFTPALMNAALSVISLRGAFWVVTGLAAASSVAILQVRMPAAAVVTRTTAGGIFPMLRGLWPLTLTIAFMGASWGAFSQFTPLLAARHPWIGPPGVAYTVYGLCMIGSRVFIGRRLDQLNRRVVLAGGFALLACALAALSVAPSQPLALLAVLALAIPSGVLHPLLALMHVERVTDDARGRASSVFYMGFDLGIGGGAWLLAPALSAFDVGGLFLGAAGFAVIGALVSLVVTRRRGDPQVAPA